MQEEITKKEEKLEESVVENQQLREHINGLFERETAFHGKHISQCKERSARYKLSALRNRAQMALAVGKQIGLNCESINTCRRRHREAYTTSVV